MPKRVCKLCGVEESENIIFHEHHIKPKKYGGDPDGKTVDLCNDCHADIHYPEHEDGDLKDIEEDYKEAIAQNIFSEGHGIVPNKILHDPKISSFAKLLYCDISSLCASRGYCWATNEYFSRVFNSHVRTIARAMVELEPFIIVRNKMSAKRIIWVHQLGNTMRPFEKKQDSKIKKKLIAKAKKPVMYTQDDLFLAELLLSKIIYNFPTFENKKVKIEDWAEDIRKLREIDKASVDQINFMITWVHGGEILKDGKPTHKFEPHEFWAKNIMSANKLRKQWFNNLVPQLQEAVKKHIKKNVPTQL